MSSSLTLSLLLLPLSDTDLGPLKLPVVWMIDQNYATGHSILTFAVFNDDIDTLARMMTEDMCNRIVQKDSFDVYILSGELSPHTYTVLKANLRSVDWSDLESLQGMLPLSASLLIPEMELTVGNSSPCAAILQGNFGELRSIDCDQRKEVLIPEDDMADTCERITRLSVDSDANALCGVESGPGVMINDRPLAVRLLATHQNLCRNKDIPIFGKQIGKDRRTADSTLVLKNMRTSWIRVIDSIADRCDSDRQLMVYLPRQSVVGATAHTGPELSYGVYYYASANKFAVDGVTLLPPGSLWICLALACMGLDISKITRQKEKESERDGKIYGILDELKTVINLGFDRKRFEILMKVLGREDAALKLRLRLVEEVTMFLDSIGHVFGQNSQKKNNNTNFERAWNNLKKSVKMKMENQGKVDVKVQDWDFTPCHAVCDRLAVLTEKILINDEQLIADIKQLFARWI